MMVKRMAAVMMMMVRDLLGSDMRRRPSARATTARLVQRGKGILHLQSGEDAAIQDDDHSDVFIKLLF